MKRSELIQQLRHALHEAESPYNQYAEFELLDDDFCILLEDDPDESSD